MKNKIDLYLETHNNFKFSDICDEIVDEKITFDNKQYIYTRILDLGYFIDYNRNSDTKLLETIFYKRRK